MITSRAPSRWSAPRMLSLVVLPAIALRVLAVVANDTPHGDVLVSALVAESITEGEGLEIPGRWLRPYATEPWGGGMPVDGQPPLWPILAAPLTSWLGDGYLAVRLLSLTCGVLLLPVAYVTLRSLFTRDAAALAVVALAYAFVLIDYSGNGSLYTLQAIALLGFAHLLAKAPRPSTSVALGAILGLSMLLHQGSLVMLGALLLDAVLACRRGGAGATPSAVTPRADVPARGAHLRRLVVVLATAAMVMSPWWVRNVQLFGDPFFQSHYLFVLYRMEIPWHLVDAGTRDFIVTFDDVPAARAVRVFLYWLARNGTFLLRTLALVMSVFLVFAAYRAGLFARDGWRGERRTLGTVAIPLLYAAIACAWPVFQFRCVVPILPFVAGLGADAILRLPARWRRATVVIALLSVATASGVTAWRVPTRTYYYGGDEATYQAQQAEIRAVSRILSALPEGQVASPELSVHAYTDYPWIYLPPDLTPEDRRRFVTRYGIRYLVTDRPEAPRYRETFAPRVHHDGTYFVLMEVPGAG